MLDKLAGIEERYEEINRLLMEVGDDYQRAAELNSERVELEPMVTLTRNYRQVLERLDEARSLRDSDDDDLRMLAEGEIEELQPKSESLERQIKAMLLPKDKRDDRNVILEIRAGTGGDEAALFAADLFRLYSRYAENRRWTIEVLSSNEIGIGGIQRDHLPGQRKRGVFALEVRVGRAPRAAHPGNRIIRAYSHLNGDSGSAG